jgi:hypothetical protein
MLLVLRFAQAMTEPAATPPVAPAARRRRSIRWSQETIAIMGVGVPILLAVLGVLWNTFSLDARITSEVARLEAAVADIRRTIREEHVEIRDAMRSEHADMRREHADMRREHAGIWQALRDQIDR